MSNTVVTAAVCGCALLAWAMQSARAADQPSWQAAGWGGGGFYWACAFDPARDGTIYMGGDVAGVYRTDDKGEHWRLINNGLVDYAVFSLATDPTQPGTIYAGTTSGLCKSRDRGEHWTFLKQSDPKALNITAVKGKSVHSIAVDPRDGNVLWAGTPDGRILRSRDGGETWEVVHRLSKAGASVATVAISPADSRLLLAATSEGILRSEDAGATWQSVGPRTPASAVAFAPSQPDTVYAAALKQQVLKSADSGKTWTPASAGLQPTCEAIDVVIDPADPANVFCIGAAGWDGFFHRSSDGGRTWQLSRSIQRDLSADPTLPDEGGSPDAPTTLSNPRNLAINPLNPAELFIAANWRPCFSSDGGQTWQERDRAADISCVYDIRFAAGKTYVTAMDEGLLVSEDDGANWRQLAPTKWSKSISGHQWRVLVWDEGKSILTTCSPWDEPINGVLRSDDAGRSFQFITKGLPSYLPTADTMWGRSYPRALAADPTNPNTLYLGMDGAAEPAKGRSGGGVFKSVDGGRSWQQLASQPASRRMFFGLVVDPTNPNRLYWGCCGDNGGVYRSDDAGNTWQRIFKNETWVFNLAISPTGVLYCPGNNLWRSADHGNTWQQLTRLSGGTIVALEIDPRDENTIWFATTSWDSRSAAGGVYKTTDAGKTWQDITGDLPYRKPMVLRLNPATGDLWAGGVGLFKLKQ